MPNFVFCRFLFLFFLSSLKHDIYTIIYIAVFVQRGLTRYFSVRFKPFLWKPQDGLKEFKLCIIDN